MSQEHLPIEPNLYVLKEYVFIEGAYQPRLSLDSLMLVGNILFYH